jgi:type IV pilus assembly protein PilY1
MEPPRIVDRNGQPAIGDDGLPIPGTQSLWSEQPDADLLAGGAAAQLPEARQVYSDVASTRITDPANRLEPGAGRFGRALLGLGPLDPESPDEVLEGFLALRELADPGLSAAAIAEYPADGLRVAYAASHDGLLHAFDADSGVELWAWIPEDLLSRLPLLVRDDPTTARSHGIDGPLVLHRHDPNGDGVIEAAAGEHLWLVFGLGRGGGRYHALDVSEPRDPRLLWTFRLPEAQTLALAEPVVARLAIAESGQEAGDWVVVLAGGYDREFDAPDAGGPGAGGTLHAIDATTGRLLWSTGREQGDLRIEGLASIAAAPRLLDLDGDRAVDRAYLVDVAGDLWRIDFESGRAARVLASATRLARLGGAGRRFHYTPDASIVRRGTRTALAVALGSGSSMRPRGRSADERLFLIYDGIHDAPARDLDSAQLFDATGPHAGMPPDAPGFFLRLAGHGPGEKLAGPTSTFDHVLRFQTYQPLPIDAEAPCGPPRSIARSYAIDIRTAAPPAAAHDSEEDEPEEIPASGLPPALRFGFPGRWDEACAGCRPRPFGILGGETFDTGYAGDPVRTSWRKLTPPDLR